MTAFQEYKMRRNKYNVINSWGIGGDDVMMIITTPTGDTEYYDLSFDEAFSLARDLITQAQAAKDIDASYQDTCLGDWLLSELLDAALAQ